MATKNICTFICLSMSYHQIDNRVGHRGVTFKMLKRAANDSRGEKLYIYIKGKLSWYRYTTYKIAPAGSTTVLAYNTLLDSE